MAESVNGTFFDSSLAVGSPLAVVAGAVASAAGIGGGGLFVPIFLLGVGLSDHYALPLAQCAILGVGLGGSLFVLPRMHPSLPRRLVDLHLCALLLPAAVAGTVPGVLLNELCPDYLITGLLALLLGVTAVLTARKGIQQRRSETEVMAEETARLLGRQGDVQLEDEESSLSTHSSSLSSYESGYDGQWRWSQGLAAVVSMAAVAGGEAGKAFLPCGSVGYWLARWAPLPMCGVVVGVGVRGAAAEQRWGAVGLAAAGFGAGLAGGWLAIGGGMVLSPLMLVLRVTPLVATATGLLLVLCTAWIVVAQYALLGRLIWYQGLWYGSAGLLGALLGQLLVVRLIRRLGRQSFLVLFIALVVAACAVALIVTNILQILSGRGQMHFSGPC